jgi:hypothetical protein
MVNVNLQKLACQSGKMVACYLRKIRGPDCIKGIYVNPMHWAEQKIINGSKVYCVRMGRTD